MDWDFSTNQTIDEDTLNTKVPEAYRPAYVAGEDGSYTISDTHKPFTDAIGGLGKALGNERKVVKDLRGKSGDADTAVSAALAELGFEGADLEAAKEQLGTMKTQLDAAGKVDLDKLKADMQKRFDKDRETIEGERDAMRGSLERYMVEAAATSALAEAKGNGKLLMPVVRDSVELVKEGDDYVVRVKDGDGDYRGDGQGGFMTIGQYVEELRASKDYAVAFESEARNGTQQDDKRGKPGPAARRGSNDDTPANGTDRIARGLRNRRSR